MNKSLKKPLYVHNSILKKIKLGKDITQIWDKSSVILPIWVEKEVLIYNGHQWKKLQVESLVNSVLLEFKLFIRKKK